MFSNIFNTLFYNPIYNGLIFLESSFPWIDLGVAIIIITIIVKLILFPLARKSIITQMKIKDIEPLLSEVKEKYKDNKEMLAMKTMEIYKENQINPFSSFLLILVQLPILFALYFVFIRGGLPEVNTDIIYSFIDAPSHLKNVHLFGLIDITKKSFILALGASISQFFQIKLTMPETKLSQSKERTMKDDLVRNMQLQMRYILPVIIFFISYGLLSAVALYWTTSNLFMIGQELYLRKTVKNKHTNGK